MNIALDKIRQLFHRRQREQQSFEDLLQSACDEPLVALSAQALSRSLSLQPSMQPLANLESNQNDPSHPEAFRFQ